jgi:type VI secretion system secreted protein VgrG
MAVITPPLAGSHFHLVGFTGREGMSQLFNIQLDLLADNQGDVLKPGDRPVPREIPFSDVLGQAVAVEMLVGKGQKRYFHGICNRLTQGECNAMVTTYRMELVPRFWLLTKRARSRIFQHLSVPQILEQVLEGIDYQMHLDPNSRFEPRDYCVQYRESDFNFACRLMEEEGIYYFFRHAADGHKLVLANTPEAHPDLCAAGPVIYEDASAGMSPTDRVYDWDKTQTLVADRYTLRDHCFELTGERPGTFKDLQAEATLARRVDAGTVAHYLRSEIQPPLELYDFPGEYAQRFDGVTKGGGDQTEQVGKIFGDARRTAGIRMQQEALAALIIQGASGCPQFAVGGRFTIARHLNADGEYLLTAVAHYARVGGSTHSGPPGDWSYHNTFTCIPGAVPFRPPRTTPKPFVQGTQTAVVVGSGADNEEIFTDRYGRVKVQFHWDRQGQYKQSSCWVRVGTPWAGKQWGMIHIPRIGQEVIVDFLEGDPDQPIIVGSVYNAEQMPPFLNKGGPVKNPTQSGLRTRSSPKGGEDNCNELRFEDKKGEEDIYFHAEKDFHRVVENDDDLKVGHNQTIEVKNDRTEVVKEGNEQVSVKKGDRTVKVEKGKNTLLVKDDCTVTVDEGKHTLQVKQGDRVVKIDQGKDDLKISQGDQKVKLDMGKIETEAMQSIEIKVGQNSIKLEQSGITIKGLQVKIEGTIQSEMKGALTTVKADGLLTVKGGMTMIN